MIANIVPLRVTERTDDLLHIARSIAQEQRAIQPHTRYRGEHLRRDLRLLGGTRRLYGPVVNVLPFDYDLWFGSSRGVAKSVSTGAQAIEDIAIHLHVRSNCPPELDLDANPLCYSDAELATHLHELAAALVDAAGKAPSSRGRTPMVHSDARRYHRDTSLLSLLNSWSRQTPSACAVRDGNTGLSYDALDRRANALAHRLVARGVEIGQPVGVLGHRGVEAIVAMVGILITGGAYVPLDAAYPPARLATMAEETELLCVVEVGGARHDLDVPTVTVDHEDSVQPPTLTRPLTGADLAYVMFTSGSTGRPKAVGVPYRAVSRLVVDTNCVSISQNLTTTARRFCLTAALGNKRA